MAVPNDPATPGPPTGNPLIATVSQRGAWTAMRIQEYSLMDATVIESLGDHINALLTQGYPRLVLDFKKVEYISSSMVGVLVGSRQSAEQAGGQLILAGLNDRLLELLRLTRLDRMFRIEPDLRTAMKSVGAVK